MLDEIGRKRGGLRPGGVIDRHKASEVLLHDMRSGKMGAISFETVAEWEIKWAEQERLRLEAQALAEAEAEAEANKNERTGNKPY